MSNVIEDFQKAKKSIKKVALWNIVVIMISIAITLSCYFTHQSSICVLFGVISGLAGEFLLIVGAERLEIRSHEKASQ